MKFGKFEVPAEPVDISEWGCEIEDPNGGPSIKVDKCYVRTLTVSEFSEFVALASKREDDGRDFSLARVAVRFALEDDKTGKRLFTEDDLLDIVNSNVKPAERIRQAIWRLNSISLDDAAKLKKN